MSPAPSKTLVILAAGLGWNLVEKHKPATSIEFRPVAPGPLSLTCPAQASLRTGLPPSRHGIVASGWFHRDLARPYFWEQSAALVRGRRIWEGARAAGQTVGMAFWQQSLGESADLVISPKPIHRHHGGILMDCYTRPEPLYAELCADLGRRFDLYHYWGPLARTRVGRWISEAVRRLLRRPDGPDHLFVYLPSLDYAQQRHGPDSPETAAALAETLSQIQILTAAAEAHDREWLLTGDYAIEAVTAADGAVFPNRLLRAAGLFHTRETARMLYPDFYTSRAFAVVDHQIAHVHIPASADLPQVRDLLAADPGIDEILDRPAQIERDIYDSARSGDLLLIAAPGRWFAYPWWTEPRQAPDYASHMDIHNKPGFDPCELFFGFPPPHTSQNTAKIRGTHGRSGPGHEIAAAGLFPEARTFADLAAALRNRLTPAQ
ncbi:MAG: alkaline phosphatase family protein [Lentisphaerae bacterium]|nr:alkaline phosphatase family protein [Lentisphaerota bacterium]